MLHQGLIPTQHINEVEIMVNYLAGNNIFKYEKREYLDDCPDEIKGILADIRFKYWQSKGVPRE